jgi:hypothetical protein
LIVKNFAKVSAILVFVIAMAAVGGASTSAAPGDSGVILRADLSGANEVEPVETDANGVFFASLNAQRTGMDFLVNARDIQGVIMAHIHCGPAGENGPVVAWLFGEGMDGVELPSPPPSGPLAPPGIDVNGLLSIGRLTEDNLISSAPCGGSFEDFANALLSGDAYVNVHTVDHPGGEIRGQTEALMNVAVPEFEAFLTGFQEVPPVESEAFGFSASFFNAARTELIFVLVNFTPIENVMMAHIHCGPIGENGNVAAFLFGGDMALGDELPSPPPSSPLSENVDLSVPSLISYGVLTEDNLTGAEPCGTSFGALAEAILTGNAYVNVHTTENPGGEMRGQIGPWLPLTADWNIVPWHLTVCVAAEDAFAQFLTDDDGSLLNVAWKYNAEMQAFDESFDPSVPLALNSMTQICPGDVVFLNMSEDSEWLQIPLVFE